MTIWILNDPQHVLQLRAELAESTIWTLNPAVLLEAGRQNLVANDLLRLSGTDSAAFLRIDDEAHEIGLKLWEELGLIDFGLPSWALDATRMAVSTESGSFLRACLLARRIQPLIDESPERVCMAHLPVCRMVRCGPMDSALPTYAAFHSALSYLTGTTQRYLRNSDPAPPIRRKSWSPELLDTYSEVWSSQENPNAILLTQGMRSSDMLDLLSITSEQRMLVISEFSSPAIISRLEGGRVASQWQRLTEHIRDVQLAYKGGHSEIFQNPEFAEMLAALALEVIHGLELADAVAAIANEFAVRRLIIGLDFLIRERVVEERMKRDGVEVISYAHGGLIVRDPQRHAEQRVYGNPDRLWVWGDQEFKFVTALRPELAMRTEAFEPFRRSADPSSSPIARSSTSPLTVLLLTSPASFGSDNTAISTGGDIVDLWLSMLDMAASMPAIRFVIRTHGYDDREFYGLVAMSAPPNVVLQRSGEVSDLEHLKLAVMVQAVTSAVLDVARLAVPVVHLTQGVFDHFLTARDDALTSMSVPSVAELRRLVDRLDDVVEYERRLADTLRLCTSMTRASEDSPRALPMRDIPQGAPGVGATVPDDVSLRLKPLLSALRGNLEFTNVGTVEDREIALLAAVGRCSGEGLVVRRGFSDAIEGGSSALDLGDDVVDGLGPHERLGVVVPV